MGLIDKTLVKQRFTKAAPTYADHASVQARVAKDLCARLTDFCTRTGHEPGTVLETGCGTGLFTKQFISKFSPKELILNDICESCSSLPDEISTKTSARVSFIPGDAENLDLRGIAAPDTILSCSVFQWFEDLPAFLSKAADALVRRRDAALSQGRDAALSQDRDAALSQDRDVALAAHSQQGVLAFSTFLRGNLQELETLTGPLLDYYDRPGLEAILSSRFKIEYIEEQESIMLFNSFPDILRHLKSTGATGVRPASFWTKAKLREYEEKYREEFSFKRIGKLPLTYRPVIVIATVK